MNAELVMSVLRALEKEDVRYKVVGGVALNLLGIIRATRDLDIFVASDEDNVARLRVALQSVFDDPEIEGITADDLGGSYPAIQYVPPEGEFHIDILNRLGDLFTYEGIEADDRLIEGVRVPVATARMLYLMKKDTVRLQDKADAERLRRYFDVGE
jgi:hypothetical protein